jgi:hypothetical protein
MGMGLGLDTTNDRTVFQSRHFFRFKVAASRRILFRLAEIVTNNYSMLDDMPISRFDSRPIFDHFEAVHRTSDNRVDSKAEQNAVRVLQLRRVS